ncbi:MAG TPA: PspC domain-containing protein [Roseiflexaceae bacterium]|nr:PspC domain-containing protein [Roseiflexaceae bacterium]
MMNTQLTRSVNDRMIGGVCGGLAAYFNIDSTIVRLVFVLAVLSGISPLVYLVLWIVMPEQKGAASNNSVAALPGHPRTAEEWKYDPYTGERIER